MTTPIMPTRTLQGHNSTNVRTTNKAAPAWVRSTFAGASRLAPGATAAVAARLFRSTRRSPARPGERDVLRSATPFRIAGMQVWSWGEGPTVLLVHGWNGRATQLGAFVEPLVSRGHRVVAFDAHGHGDSIGKQSSLPELALSIRQVVEELGGVESIIAHSLGGAATTFAMAYGLGVQRAVFISPPSDPQELLNIFGGALGIDEEVRDRVKARVERRFGVPLEEMHATRFAPAMRVPLLVIHDKHDKEVPLEVGRSIAAAWPGAELLVTEGLGHQRILRDDKVRDVAVSFIDASTHLMNAA